MPGLVANAEIYGTLVGENPLTGIVKARLSDGTAFAVLGYDEATQTALVFASHLSAGSAAFAGALTANNGMLVYAGLTIVTGSFVVGGDPGGLETIRTTGSARIAGNLYAGNVYAGHAGSGTGGEYIAYDDAGTLRWASGIIGSAGERNWSIYDNVHSRYVAIVSATTGALTIPLGLVVPNTVSAAASGEVVLDSSGGANQLLANNASIVLTAGPPAGAFYGLMNVTDSATAFAVGGYSSVQLLTSDPTYFSAVQGTAGRLNLFSDTGNGNRLTLENKTGSAKVFRLSVFRF